MTGKGARGIKGRVVAASAAALATAGILAGWWSAQAGEASGGPAPAASRPAPSAPGTGQTSSAAPVSMDIAHAAESGDAKAVDITIDDGPDPVWTPKILKVLKDNGVKAVFCMIGPQAAAHPDVVRQVVADGHRLCDHTVSHNTAMDHRSQDYQRHQVMDAAQQIAQASGGVQPMYYRAPGGAFTPYSRQIAAAAGMRPLGWNVDSKDFERPGTPAILRTVRNELRNGPTLLFHDGGGNRAQTVAALEQLLPWLKQHGYSFSFPVR